MAKYLQMDGVDDKLVSSGNLNFTEVSINFKPRPLAWEQYVNLAGRPINRTGSNTDTFHADFQAVYVDGMQVAANTAFIKINQRQTLKGVLKTAITGTANFMWNTGTNYLESDIFDIKIYNGTALVAHYDMSTGTVLDQSGNGNHATLTGGTWLDDGTGGGTDPVGEDGSALFQLSQNIYSDQADNYSTSQTLYQDDFSMSQSKQYIYSDELLNINTNQSIYEDSYVPFATLQEIFNDGQIGSINYPLLLQIYSDEIANLITQQSIYESGLNQFSVSQNIYENNQTQNSTKQTIYSDSFNHYNLSQKIYSDNSSGYVTNQSFYEANSFALDTIQQLFEHSSMNLQTKQFIYHLDTVELLTLQSIYEDNSMSIDTLQQILADYVEYRQVFKYLLSINQKMNFELVFTGNQKFDIGISDQVKKYDLNI